jgi:hypothetical protein
MKIMGVLYIKKKILAILMVGLFVATVLGTLSVSAEMNTKQLNKPYFPTGYNNTGGVAVKVFDIDIIDTDDIPRTIIIEDATVTCTDHMGTIHQLSYEEIIPDIFLYVAYDIPAGQCEITASKEGFSSKTINGQIFPEIIERYEIELEETPKPRFASYHPLLLRIIQAFQILIHLF